MVLSRYPISDAHYHMYTTNGKWYNIHHSDYFGAKGVGLVRLRTPHGTVDVFTSHLHAKYIESESTVPDEYLATRLSQVTKNLHDSTMPHNCVFWDRHGSFLDL